MPARYSYKDLYIATDGFSQQIGKGGFGSVFSGTLGDNTKVAVKQLVGGEKAEKQVEAEVAAIGSIDHVNLVHPSLDFAWKESIIDCSCMSFANSKLVCM